MAVPWIWVELPLCPSLDGVSGNIFLIRLTFRFTCVVASVRHSSSGLVCFLIFVFSQSPYVASMWHWVQVFVRRPLPFSMSLSLIKLSTLRRAALYPPSVLPLFFLNYDVWFFMVFLWGCGVLDTALSALWKAMRSPSLVFHASIVLFVWTSPLSEFRWGLVPVAFFELPKAWLTEDVLADTASAMPILLCLLKLGTMQLWGIRVSESVLSRLWSGRLVSWGLMFTVRIESTFLGFRIQRGFYRSLCPLLGVSVQVIDSADPGASIGSGLADTFIR